MCFILIHNLVDTTSMSDDIKEITPCHERISILCFYLQENSVTCLLVCKKCSELATTSVAVKISEVPRTVKHEIGVSRCFISKRRIATMVSRR